MKIAHVITRMIVGGAQENTLLSAEGQAAVPGNEVYLITGTETGSEGDLLDGYDGPVHIVRMPEMVRSVHPILDLKSVVNLTRVLRELRPDVVHTHSSKAGVVGRVAGKAARIPVVVHTLHSLVFHDYQPWPLRTSLRLVKRTMVPFTDHYVSVSDNIKDRAIAAHIGRPERHSTVYSGFDTDQFVESLLPQEQARAELGLPLDRPVVGVVGRLFELKGHDDIISAAELLVARVPDVLFTFVGSGPLEPELRARIASLGLERNFHFTGRLAPTAMPVAYSAFDVLAHASLREGLARVIPQAVLAGRPVVCYELDGSAEIVDHGVNGYLVPARRTDLLARYLEELTIDPDLRKQLGGVRQQWIRQEFSDAHMARQLLALYDELLERGSIA